ncbi:transcriptional regulator, TetR family [Actinopolyspora alba]|uniref:Transcriptional regulator, TetR family n=1 Tax=Actinopolyspora alba TaxID=673379 RepID=A0A1I2CD66_9ACTN|nr:TetR/AcrR family transcriptional regulator [Actinopolyspora alba]SFE66158.1 transcriptional regulator, TetR family [Actinopolyspora alba]
MSSSTGQGTRERWIVTAERLFAERGISEVSLREVGLVAGQRNTSAAQYHFGDKETLVNAILDHRMSGINEHRLRLLAEQENEARTELRDLLTAFIVPLASSADETDSHHGRFLAQYFSQPAPLTSWDWEVASSLRSVRTGIRRCLGELPEAVLHRRMRMLVHLVLHTIADHEHIDPLTDPHRPAHWTIDLIDAAHGMLTAPITPSEASRNR